MDPKETLPGRRSAVARERILKTLAVSIFVGTIGFALTSGWATSTRMPGRQVLLYGYGLSFALSCLLLVVAAFCAVQRRWLGRPMIGQAGVVAIGILCLCLAPRLWRSANARGEARFRSEVSPTGLARECLALVGSGDAGASLTVVEPSAVSSPLVRRVRPFRILLFHETQGPNRGRNPAYDTRVVLDCGDGSFYELRFESVRGRWCLYESYRTSRPSTLLASIPDTLGVEGNEDRAKQPAGGPQEKSQKTLSKSGQTGGE
jgi:hypothetical protein